MSAIKIYIPIIVDTYFTGEENIIVGAFKDVKTTIKHTISRLVKESLLDKKTYLLKNGNKEKSIKDEEFIEYMYSKYDWNENNYYENLNDLCDSFGSYYDDRWIVVIEKHNLI